MSDYDPFYLAAVRQLPCLACGKSPPNEAHHVKSRGAGGGDDYWNLIPLCNEDHVSGPNAWHRLGAISFVHRFPWVRSYLIQLGWDITTYRLIPPLQIAPRNL